MVRTEKVESKERSEAKRIGKVKLPSKMTPAEKDNLLFELAKMHGLIDEVQSTK